MTETRYQELLGQLLDGSLSDLDAEELCRELEHAPDRLRNVREHLMLSELLAQEHSPQRGPEAFWEGIQARIRTESDGIIQIGRSNAPQGISHQATKRTPWRLAAGLAAGLLVATVIAMAGKARIPSGPDGPLQAPDGPESILVLATPVSLDGKAVCTHCTLHQTKECQTAVHIQSREGDDEQTLFLSDNTISRDFKRKQGCGRTPLLVHAEGTVHTEHGRRLLVATRLEIQH